MSLMLASVSNLKEARTVLTAGIDIIDLKNPASGALGAVNHHIAEGVVNYVKRRCLVSATIGDLPMQPELISKAISDMSSFGVDIIKVGVFSSDIPEDVLAAIQAQTQRGIQVVLVLFADLSPKLDDFDSLADANIYGLMLDTVNKKNGSLRTILDKYQLKLFIEKSRSCGLLTGLAGSLRTEDITPLLSLQPDYLGFRGALCKKFQRVASIDALAVRRIRNMIPASNISVKVETLDQTAI